MPIRTTIRVVEWAWSTGEVRSDDLLVVAGTWDRYAEGLIASANEGGRSWQTDGSGITIFHPAIDTIRTWSPRRNDWHDRTD